MDPNNFWGSHGEPGFSIVRANKSVLEDIES